MGAQNHLFDPGTKTFLAGQLRPKASSKNRIGRRRGWLVIVQIGLAIGLFAMSAFDPKTELYFLGAAAIWVAFLSASQDVLIDAFRRESLSNQELALGSTFYLYGYRAAMFVSGGLALTLANHISWEFVYRLMGIISLLIGLGTTFWSAEPKIAGPPPRTLRETVVDPLVDFFTRPAAVLILLFILLYKLGDVMAGNMLSPYYLKMGYNLDEIAWIAKSMSLPINLFGAFLGGAFVLKNGIYRGLVLFGILQMLATLGFNVLLLADHSRWALGFVILSEDLSTSMATAAFIAYMATLANVRFTATQYALISGLSGVPRTLLAAPTGIMVEWLGWGGFFSLCSLIALPGLLLLWILRRRGIVVDS